MDRYSTSTRVVELVKTIVDEVGVITPIFWPRWGDLFRKSPDWQSGLKLNHRIAENPFTPMMDDIEHPFLGYKPLPLMQRVNRVFVPMTSIGMSTGNQCFFNK